MDNILCFTSELILRIILVQKEVGVWANMSSWIG